MMFGSGRLLRGLKAFSQGFFIGVPVCLTFTDNFFTVCQVEGVSMQPVLNNDSRRKDFVLVSRWKAKKYEKIERGDIVSVISPKDPDMVFIKRIIALEGDTVRTLSFKTQDVRVPRGHCWIEGDNHQHSLDSNSFGTVPIGLVNGVATRIVWPPSRWGKLSNQLPVGRNPFNRNTEFEKHETGLSVNDKDINNAIEHLSEASLSDSKEQISDISISSDSSPTRVGKEMSTKSSNLLTHLPQNTLRHASDSPGINTKKE